jgi:hypothetical protein
MYALFVLWTLLSTLALEAVLRDARRSALVGYASASLCGLMTHYAYVAVILVQLTFVCLPARRPAWKPLFAIASTSAIGAVLTLPFLVRDLGAPTGGHREFTWLAIPYTAFAFLAGFGIGPSLEDLHRGTTIATLAPFSTELGIVIAVGIVLGVAGIRGLRNAGPWSSYLLLMLTIPMAFALATSRVAGNSFNVRYVIGALPFFEVLLALGLEQCGRAFTAMGVAALVAIAALSIGRDSFDPYYSREDVRGASTYLESVAAPGDSILLSAKEVRLTFAHYMRGSTPLGQLPASAFTSVAGAAVALQVLAAGHHATWLVLCREWDEDLRGMVRHEIAAEGLTPSAEFPGVRIYRLGKIELSN